METISFGGVGISGIGRHYGKYGFDSLLKPRNILFSNNEINIDLIHPPYTDEKLNTVEAIFK